MASSVTDIVYSPLDECVVWSPKATVEKRGFHGTRTSYINYNSKYKKWGDDNPTFITGFTLYLGSLTNVISVPEPTHSFPYIRL